MFQTFFEPRKFVSPDLLKTGIDDLWFSRKRCVAEMLPPAMERPATPLLPINGKKRVRRHFGWPAQVRPIIVQIPNAIVSGGCQVGTRRKIFRLPTDQRWVWKWAEDGFPPAGDFSLKEKSEKRVPGLSVLLTNWNSMTYGHWLLEGLPKLLWLKRNRDKLPPFQFVTSRERSHAFLAWTKYLIPDIPIVEYDEAAEFCLCDHLLLPGVLLDGDYRIHPLMNEMIEELRQGVPSSGFKKIIVNRPDTGYRRMENKLEIQAIARARGYEMISPECYSLPEQISIFSSATKIIGEYGSALHNTLFSAEGTHILCLNWINPLQSRISALRQQRIGYLLPEQGPTLYERAIKTQQVFTIDPEKFAAACDVLDAEEAPQPRLRAAASRAGMSPWPRGRAR